MVDSTGQVTLTVEASAATSYTLQHSTNLEGSLLSSPWSHTFSDSLSSGTNTILIDGNQYNWPVEKVFFRILTPAEIVTQ